ncbi:hypothetical protein KI372_12595, partial [Halobacterium salinarum]|nr:hypothetical protein [Halobacterium salinarum]
MREYAFELRLCAHLEADGVPGVGEAGVERRPRQHADGVHDAPAGGVHARPELPGDDARLPHAGHSVGF